MKILTKLLLAYMFMVTLIIPEALAAKTPNPYKVLGIQKDATEEQIKKAFNKRSKKYHPDRNKTDPRAKQKFEKVVNAYELLKDPERKKMYDLTGSDDPQQMNMGGGGGFPGGFGFEDLFNMGFGGGFGGFGGGQRGQRGGQRTGRTYTFTFGGGGAGRGGQNGGFRFQM